MSRGLGVFDSINSKFSEFALRGHEADLDYDEARLVYLRMLAIEYLRRSDISGYYNTLIDRNKIKVKLGLPSSNFEDLTNAAALHHAIFYDPSSIRIAEEAFYNQGVSSEDNEMAKYMLASLYTAHGFSDKALEVYSSIDAAGLGGDGLFEETLRVDKAFNYVLLGDFEEAAQLLATAKKSTIGDIETAKLDFDLLTLALHHRVMTPEKKADLLTARRSIHNILTLTRLNSMSADEEALFQPGGTVASVDITHAELSGNLEDLLPVTEIEQARIEGFINLVSSGLGGSPSVSDADRAKLTALRAFSNGEDQAFTDSLRALQNGPGEPGASEASRLFQHYSTADAAAIEGSKILSEDPESATLEYIIRARVCLKTGDYACSWSQFYAAKTALRSVSRAGLSDFLIADLEMLLLTYENDAGAVLDKASRLFENYGQYIPNTETGYEIVNRTASVFERAGLTDMAHRIITLDGKAGMAQPYANHMTEVRLMLALSKYREAKDRLSTLVMDDSGSPRRALYEKAMSYSAHAALGETNKALSLAQDVRTGIRGLNDPLLDGLAKPYLFLGDYHVYTYYKPFEAEQYRARYLKAVRLADVAQTQRSGEMAEARVRALNASEMRALDTASTQLGKAENRASTFSRLTVMLAAFLGALAIIWARLRRREKALAAENEALAQSVQTHEYFMGEMERQTELETTALGAVMDTLARSQNADPTLTAQKVGDHAVRLRETVARLAFQNRVFTGSEEPRTKLNLNELSAALSEHFQDQAARKDVSLHFDIGPLVRTAHIQKALLSETLRTFLGYALEHTSCDVIEVTMRPLAYKEQTFLRTTISDEGDGLAKFDHRLKSGDVSPDMTMRLTDAQTRGFSADTVIMAINKAGGRFESEATPGFGHVLRIDLPATLLGVEEPPTPSNIIEFKKGTANDG